MPHAEKPYLVGYISSIIEILSKVLGLKTSVLCEKGNNLNKSINK
jgi:hypothetical protein